MTSDVDTTLAEILSAVLKRPLAPGETVRRTDEPLWDSLRHLEIIFAIEAAFGVSFSPEEIAAASDLSALRSKALGHDAA
jgi:acyl carrier protein